MPHESGRTSDTESDAALPEPAGKSGGRKPRRRAKTDGGAAGFAVRGVHSQLVGCDDELAEMQRLLSHAVEFHAPQMMTIVGNQGTGKSRLVAELIERHARSPMRVFHGWAEPEGKALGAIAALLCNRFDIDPDGDPDGDGAGAEPQSLVAVRGEVARVFGEERIDEVLHFLGEFVGLSYPSTPFLRLVEDSEAARRALARLVLRRFIEVDAEASPIVLVFDDLQWADEETLLLLRELGSGLGGSAVVVIACARPEMLVRCPEWGTGETDHHRIDLQNLPSGHAAAMFRNLLSRCGQVPQDVVEDAVEITGGNPMFLEQLVHEYLRGGAVVARGEQWQLDVDRAMETELPLGVEDAIEARIAAVSNDARSVLEKGAVFGNVFWLSAIVALTRIEDSAPEEPVGANRPPPPPPPDDLGHTWTETDERTRRKIDDIVRDLVERDYLLQLDPEDSTVPGDVELVFKHNLERELVVKTTPARRAARYHRLAAQWLETRLTGRSEDQLEFLAMLYERGDDHRRAAHCYFLCGDKARARYANHEAVALYRRGLSLVEDDDALARARALHNLGDVLQLVGRMDEAVPYFSEMLHLAWLFDDQAKAGAAHGRLGRIQRERGAYDSAMEHLREAHALFSRAGDQRGVAATLDDIGQVHWLRGAYGQALDFHRQGLSIRRALDDRRSIALAVANIGRVHHDSGNFKAAIQQFREALELRRETGDLPGVVSSLCDLGSLHTEDGNAQTAIELFREAQTIAFDIGDKLAQCDLMSRMGECKSQMGLGAEALDHQRKALEIATELGHQVMLSDCHRRLAESELKQGQLDECDADAQRALKIGEAVGSRVHIGRAHRVLAESAAARGMSLQDVERAEDHYRRAVEILAGIKNEPELARCYRAFAQFREQLGQSEDAALLKRRADDIFYRLRGAATLA